MKCNQEQFDKIKPKLDSLQIAKQDVVRRNLPYLVTNYGSNIGIIGFCGDWNKEANERNCYETWNEQIFLEACGIKTNNDMKLSKEFIKANADKTLKEVFPQLFALEVNKWYKCIEKGFEALAFITDLKKNEAYGVTYYGANDKNIWVDNANRGWSFGDVKNWILATEQEVEEALKNEAVKRGFVEGTWFNSVEPNIYGITKIKFGSLGDKKIFHNGKGLFNSRGWIFLNGIWAEIIPTITKQEAEKLLNKKIV